jgi:hypothetical protein
MNNPSAPNIPYGFVFTPNPTLTVEDTPVFHDGKNPSQAELLSGELQLTLTALTPLLAGNYQYADGQDSDKKIIEPLLLPDARFAHGRVAIAGTALKGMLRNNINALLAAPMERVAERTYSYRPNVAIGATQDALAVHPAVVVAADYYNNSLELDILDSKYLASGSLTFLKADDLLPAGHKKFNYIFGIDGTGDLARAFYQSNPGAPPPTVYTAVAVPHAALVSLKKSGVKVHENIIEQYKATRSKNGALESKSSARQTSC